MLLEPPTPETSVKPDVPAIVVHLTSDGSVFVNRKISTLELVRGSISRERAESPHAALIVQVDDGVKSSSLLRVRDAAYSAGYYGKVGVMVSDTEA